MAATDGIEPPTPCSSGRRSTDELRRRTRLLTDDAFGIGVIVSKQVELGRQLHSLINLGRTVHAPPPLGLRPRTATELQKRLRCATHVFTNGENLFLPAFIFTSMARRLHTYRQQDGRRGAEAHWYSLPPTVTEILD